MLNAKLGCEMRTANATTDRSNDEDAQVDFESVESRSELNLVDNSSSSDDAEENDREMDIEDLVIRDEFNAYSTIESSQMKLQNLPQSTSSITTSKDHQTLQRSLSDNSLVSRHQTQQNQPSDSTLEPSIVSSSLITTSPIAYRHKSLSPSPNSKYEYKASICAQSIEIEYLLHNAVFFLARSSAQNIELAKQKSYWTTTKRIEQIYDETFDRAAIVILIFIETKGDHFCGFARICSKALYRGQPALCWKEFSGGGNIKIEWISKSSLHISNTQHLTNHHKKVYMAQDGAKIGASVGRELCGMFALDDESIDVVDLRRRILRGGSGGEKRLLDGEQGSAYKHSIPSLFDDPVSYDQFKRAKRNLTNQEYDTSVISNPPSLLHHFQPAFLPSNERKYVELNGPVPLMDVSLGSCYSLTVRSAPLKSLSYTHRDTSDRRYSSSHDRHNYKQIDHYESSSNYQSPSNHRRHTSRNDSYRRISSNDSKISKTKHTSSSSQKPINDYDFKYKRKRFS